MGTGKTDFYIYIYIYIYRYIHTHIYEETKFFTEVPFIAGICNILQVTLKLHNKNTTQAERGI